MERTLKINRKLVIAFLIAAMLYLTVNLYQELQVEFDWVQILFHVLFIGIFIWSILTHHLKKVNEPFEISLLGVGFMIGLFLLLALVGYLTYY